jgi:hypothetical protein
MDETLYGFIIEKEGKRYDCMILADEEGNGPGHLDISVRLNTKANANK